MRAAIWWAGGAITLTALVVLVRWTADRVALRRFGVDVSSASAWWATLSRLREANATGRVGRYTAQAVRSELVRSAASPQQRQALDRNAPPDT